MTNFVGGPDDWDTLEQIPSIFASLWVPGDPQARTRDDDPEMKSWENIVILEPVIIPWQAYNICFRTVFGPEVTILKISLSFRWIGMRIGHEDFFPAITLKDGLGAMRPTAFGLRQRDIINRDQLERRVMPNFAMV